MYGFVLLKYDLVIFSYWIIFDFSEKSVYDSGHVIKPLTIDLFLHDMEMNLGVELKLDT